MTLLEFGASLALLNGLSEGVEFGASVDINAIGNTIVIGSPSDRGGSSVGKVFVYEYVEASTNWSSRGIPIVGHAEQDMFGSLVAFCT